jgi:competence protein ComEC
MSSLPRSGWLAAGVVGAALAIPVLGPSGPGAMGIASIVLAVAGAWLPAPPRRRAAIAFALGLGLIALRVGIGPGTTPLNGAPDGPGPWTMIVEAVGSPRSGQQTATLRTVAAGADGFRLAATLPRFPTIEPGDQVVVGGRTRPRPETPYGEYLARLGAWGNLDARSMEVAPSIGGPARWLERIRRGAGDLLAQTLPEPEAGLAAGILIGLRDRVDRAVASAFTTAGVSHVVAISGWNIAIVAAAVAAMSGSIGRRRRSVVTAVAIVAYVAFAGASPSVVRAGAMAGVVLLARETGRAGYAAAALGWAAALLLIADPGLIGDAGFQLSTVATAGLIAWATPVSERIERAGRGRLPRWLVESLGVSLAAQAATLPIVLASFGRLALVAPAVNLLVVPLVAPAMAAGIVALLAGIVVALGAPTGLAAILATPAWVILRSIIVIVEQSAALPVANVTLEPPAGAICAAALTLIIGLAIVAQRQAGRARQAGGDAGGHKTGAARLGSLPPSSAGVPERLGRAAVMGLVLSVAVAGAVVAVRPSGVASITVLDIGQGDAILIEGAHGGRLLVDGGPDPDRLLVVLDRQIPPWDRRIDAVILTHPHEDHVAGLALLLDRYRVGRVFEPGMRGPGPGYAAWTERLAGPDAPTRSGLATGDRLSVDDVRMRVLWPDRNRVPLEPPDGGTGINNVSIVLLGEVAGRRFLLTGDIEEGIDPIVVERGVPPVELLKIAHHGSKTATTAAFIGATRPRVAIASAGADNPYGHPAKSTLDRLREGGARVYRTDVDGSVTVAFEPSGMTVRSRPRTTAERQPALAATAAASGTATVNAAATVDATAKVPGPVRLFACAIPTSSVKTAGAAASSAIDARPTAAARSSAAREAAAPTAVVANDRDGRHLRYHRPDEGLLDGRDGCPAVMPGTGGPRVPGSQARSRRR